MTTRLQLPVLQGKFKAHKYMISFKGKSKLVELDTVGKINLYRY